MTADFCRNLALLLGALMIVGCGDPVTRPELIRPVRAIKVGDLNAITGREFPGRAKAMLGGRNAAARRSMTITTSLRNIAVGMVVATASFAGTPALTAVVSYGLVSLLGTLAISLVLGSVAPAAQQPIAIDSLG